jgi:tRNA-dihydrouridine synthase
LGNPWVFRPEGMPATVKARLPVIRRYLELAKEYLDSERLLFRIKNHTCRYFNGIHGAAEIRKQIIDTPSLEAMNNILDHLS